MQNFKRCMDVDFIVFPVRYSYFYYGLLLYLLNNTYCKNREQKNFLALCWFFTVLKVKINSFMLTSCKKFIKEQSDPQFKFYDPRNLVKIWDTD